jgi:hypothetical protein
MLIHAVGVQARVVTAHDLRVHELATRSGAVRAIAAGWHVRVAEGAVRVCAVGVKLAVDFVLEMLSALSRGGMFTRTLLVFAGRTE